VTVKSFRLSEQRGLRKTCLLWSKEPLDAGGKPIFITPLPRGVKELAGGDAETQPGTSFVWKQDSNWPPPPAAKGLSSSGEMCVCEVGCVVRLDVVARAAACVRRIVDPRWSTGDWGPSAPVAAAARAEVLRAGSAQSVVVLHGLDVAFFPALDLPNGTGTGTGTGAGRGIMTPQGSALVGAAHIASGKQAPLPAEISLRVGLTTLVWKPSLELKFLSPLLRTDPRALKHGAGGVDDDDDDDDDDAGGDSPTRNGDVSPMRGGSEPFPHQPGDLTHALQVRFTT